jgi:hypothetical protein
MEIIISILGIASLGTLIVNSNWYSDTLLDIRPFNCAMCSTFWYSIIPCIYMFDLNGLWISSIAAVVAELIDRKLSNY